MHRDNFDKNRRLLDDIAHEVGQYYVKVSGYDEGESYLSVTMMAPDTSTPDLSVDMKDGKFHFSTLLPRDRWGYPQRHSYTQATFCSNVSATNGAKKAAGYVRRLLANAQEVHGKNLDTVKALHDYYDRQMANAEKMAELLADLGASVDNLNGKPNHNGAVKVRVSIPGLYDSAEVEGGGVRLSLGTLTPEVAAEVLRVVHGSK